MKRLAGRRGCRPYDLFANTWRHPQTRELSIMGVTRVGIRDAYYAAIRGNGRAYRRLSRVYAVFSRRRSNDATGNSQTRESPRQTVFSDIRNARQLACERVLSARAIFIYRKSRARDRARPRTYSYVGFLEGNARRKYEGLGEARLKSTSVLRGDSLRAHLYSTRHIFARR